MGKKQATAVRAMPVIVRNFLGCANAYASFLMKKIGIGDSIRVYVVKA